ncbi:MAG: hypothetical protein WA885_01515 [Phormidesmis sp.]
MLHDYLAHDNGTDNRYELTHGELIEVPPESYDNVSLALSLRDTLLNMPGVCQVIPHGLALETYERLEA